MKLTQFLTESWQGYVKLTPDAPFIHQLLEARGETILNDHVAYRTFDLPGISRLELGSLFETWGYHRVEEDLQFPEKKLTASYYLHPDPTNPKVFISELLVDQVSPPLQEWILDLTASVRSQKKKIGPEFFLERSWAPVEIEKYQKFYSESEYAAWTAAFGIQLNHFTVLVNSLKSFGSLQGLNEFLRSNGVNLNDRGGVIKGTPAEYLEQSSTVAREVPCPFSGGVQKEIMGCYYEFAKRYPMAGTSKLFQGFIPKSADKIFESTYESKKEKSL